MIHSSDINSSKKPLSDHALHLLVLTSVLLIGWLIRGIYILIPDFPICPDGGYYPVQARSILHNGWLAIPDFPFLFYFQAMFGYILSFLLSEEQSLLLSSRLIDTFFPVLIAIPVYLFSKEFNKDKTSSRDLLYTTFIAGLMAVANSSFLRMAGDYQKNAFALPLFLFYAYYLFMAFQKPSRKNYTVAVFFFVLISLTHLGVTGLTLTFTLFFLLAEMVHHKNYRKLIVLSSVLIAFLFSTLFIVSFFDATRVNRILIVFSNPFRLFTQSGLGGPIEGYVIGTILAPFCFAAIYRQRHQIDSATLSLLWSAFLSAFLFGSPLIHSDMSSRLSLMASVPALILMIYCIPRFPWGFKLGYYVAGILFIGTMFAMFQGPHMSISREAYNELKQFKNDLPKGNSIVVAHHGLEWWVAWTMETKITNQPKIAADFLDKYDAIFYVEEINSNSMQGPRRPPPPPDGRFRSDSPDRPGPREDDQMQQDSSERQPPPPPPSWFRHSPPDRSDSKPGEPMPGGVPGEHPTRGQGPSPFFGNRNQKALDRGNGEVSQYFTSEIVREGKIFKLIRLKANASGNN